METEEAGLDGVAMNMKMTPPGDGSPAQSQEGGPLSTIPRVNSGDVRATRLTVSVNAIENLVNKEEFGIQRPYVVLQGNVVGTDDSFTFRTEPARRGGRTIWLRFSEMQGNERSFTIRATNPSALIVFTTSVYDCTGGDPSVSNDSMLASGSCTMTLGACSGNGVVSLAEPDGAPAGSLTLSLACSPTTLAFEGESPLNRAQDAAVDGPGVGDDYGDDQFEEDGYGDEEFDSETSVHDNQQSFIEESGADVPVPPPESEPEPTVLQRQPKHMTDSTLQLMRDIEDLEVIRLAKEAREKAIIHPHVSKPASAHATPKKANSSRQMVVRTEPESPKGLPPLATTTSTSTAARTHHDDGITSWSVAGSVTSPITAPQQVAHDFTAVPMRLPPRQLVHKQRPPSAGPTRPLVERKPSMPAQQRPRRLGDRPARPTTAGAQRPRQSSPPPVVYRVPSPIQPRPAVPVRYVRRGRPVTPPGVRDIMLTAPHTSVAVTKEIRRPSKSPRRRGSSKRHHRHTNFRRATSPYKDIVAKVPTERPRPVSAVSGRRTSSPHRRHSSISEDEPPTAVYDSIRSLSDALFVWVSTRPQEPLADLIRATSLLESCVQAALYPPRLPRNHPAMSEHGCVMALARVYNDTAVSVCQSGLVDAVRLRGCLTLIRRALVLLGVPTELAVVLGNEPFAVSGSLTTVPPVFYKLLSVTLNNLGCVFSKLRLFEQASGCFEIALHYHKLHYHEGAEDVMNSPTRRTSNKQILRNLKEIYRNVGQLDSADACDDELADA